MEGEYFDGINANGDKSKKIMTYKDGKKVIVSYIRCSTLANHRRCQRCL